MPKELEPVAPVEGQVATAGFAFKSIAAWRLVHKAKRYTRAEFRL